MHLEWRHLFEKETHAHTRSHSTSREAPSQKGPSSGIRGPRCPEGAARWGAALGPHLEAQVSPVRTAQVFSRSSRGLVEKRDFCAFNITERFSSRQRQGLTGPPPAA